MCDSLATLERMTEFPEKSAFYSSLAGKITVTDEEYVHAKKVFDVFECTSMKDYLLIYNRVDTALLAEIFSSYRTKIREFACKSDYVTNNITFNL